MNLHSPPFESLKDQLISCKILPVAASRLAGAMSQIVVDAGVEEPERNLSFGDAGFEDPWLSLVFPKVHKNGHSTRTETKIFPGCGRCDVAGSTGPRRLADCAYTCRSSGESRGKADFLMFRIAKKPHKNHSIQAFTNQKTIFPTVHQAVLQGLGDLDSFFLVAGRWTLYAPRWVNWRRRTPNWRTGGAQVVRHPQSRRHRRYPTSSTTGYLGYLGLSGIGCWTTYIYCFTPMIKPDWLRLLIDTYRFYIDMYCFQDHVKAPARRCLMAIHMCLIHWYET